MKRLLLAFLLVGVSLFVGCGGSSGGSNPPPTVTLVSISVTPANPSIAPGATQQFAAVGTYSDSTTKVLTSTANWLSATPSVATINTSGLATAVAAGTSTISASSGGVTGTTTLTVTAPVTLVSIAVAPPTATVAPNGQQAFTATGTYSDQSMKNITTSVTWNATAGASINPAGLAIGVTPGATSTITATLNGILSNSATLTVTNPLVSIAVTPANSSVAPGTKPQFTATGTYFDGTSNNITTLVAWSSSNTATATISSAQPTQGLALAVAGGQTTISATCTPPSSACPTGSPVSGSTLLTVTNAVITGIAVTPVNAPISLGLSQQYDAMATFNDGSQQDVTNVVAWTSSDTSKVTITTSGLARAVAVTSTPVTIAATASNGVSGSTTVTVNTGNLQSIAIKPTNVTTLAQGTQQQYSAVATFSNGSTLDVTNQVTWAIIPSGVATVAQRTGLVQANPSVPTNTQVTLSATLQSVVGSLGLNITNAIPSTLTVTPVTASVPPGVYQTFHAIAVFNDGTSQDVTQSSTWATSDPTYAVVSVPGRILSVAGPSLPNTVSVTATFGGVQSPAASLTVTNETLTSITLSPSSANLTPGATTSLQATGTFSLGSTANLAGLVTWASSQMSVATVSGGIVLGQSAGNTNITACYPPQQGVCQGVQGSAPVLVTSSPLSLITVSPSTATTYVGLTVPFTAMGTAGSQQINLTVSATWASSLSAVATVSSAFPRQGVATGVSAGSTTISAVFAGLAGTSTLNVSSATLQSIAVTPANPSPISPGSTLQFTAKGMFSDGNVVDMSSQVTWTSDNPAVAPINTAGVASGATVGTAHITATFQQPSQSLVTSNTVSLTVN